MKSSQILVLLAIVLFLLTGCAKAAPASASSSSSSSSSGEPRARTVAVEIAMTVERTDEVVSVVRDEVEREGGWVADATLSGDRDERSAHLDVRVPARDVKKLRAALAKLGEVTADSEHVSDVTEQRADLDARLHNARVQEKRILEITSGRTGSLAEVLEAEKELSRVRENIEKLEAQKAALSTQIDFAVVRLSIQPHTKPAWQTPGASLKQAAASGVKGACAVFVYGAMAFATVAPTLAPIALVIVGIVVAVRRRNRRAIAAFAAG